MKPRIPEFCDFDCPFADFPPADTAGICRTMAGVWCKKLKELVNKNTPCTWRQRQTSAKPSPRTTTKKRTTRSAGSASRAAKSRARRTS